MTLGFDPLVPWPWVAAAGLGLLLCELLPLWTLGRRRASRARAACVSGAGVLLAVAALALLAGPRLELESRAPVRAKVLVDSSRSMATEDAEGGGSRYEAALAAARALVAACPGARVEVEAWDEPGRAPGPPPAEPTGAATAPGDALARALASGAAGHEPLAAVALVSDGAGAVGRDPVAAARDARAAGVRVFTFATGGDRARPAPRLGRASLAAPERAAAGSTARVVASVEARGLDEPVALELALDGEVVGRAVVEADRGGARQAAFDVPLGAVGLRSLALRASAGSRESRAHARVRVLPGEARVALVDFPGRWEHRYLRRALEDAPRVALDRVDLWGSASSAEGTRAALAAVASADVVVLGDVPPRALEPAFGAALARAVETGTGLLVLAGRRGFDEARTLGLAPLLPVELPGDAVPVSEAVRPVATEAGRALLAGGLGARRSDGLGFLDRLPPLPSWVPLAQARRDATVLLEASARRPLLALGRHGLGRTGVLASDTTWRWAFAPREETGRPGEPGPARLHAALVRALVLELAPRDAGLRGALELDRGLARILPGEPVALGLERSGVTSARAQGVEVELSLVDPERGTVLASARVAPTARATLELPRTFGGPAVVAVGALRDAAGHEVASDERVLAVLAPEGPEEPGEPADRALLARIADAGGGAAFACEDVARGAAGVAFAGALDEARPVERRSGPLAAGPGYAVLVALLCGASWALRRGGGLA